MSEHIPCHVRGKQANKDGKNPCADMGDGLSFKHWIESYPGSLKHLGFENLPAQACQAGNHARAAKRAE